MVRRITADGRVTERDAFAAVDEPVILAASASAEIVPLDDEPDPPLLDGATERLIVSDDARGAATVDDGARGERAMIDATFSARRSSGLSSMSSKKRGVGDGCATWVSS